MADWDYIKQQRAYWENNLDPKNLGHRGQVIMPPDEVRRRMVYYNLSPHLRRVRALLGNVEGKRVLEIGGGMSVQPLILARLGADVWVADVSVRRLEAMQRLAKQWRVDVGVHPIVGPAESLPFAENSFDLVTTNAVLIHTNLAAAAGEIHRVLKPGGRAVISEPTTANPFANLYRATMAPKEWQGLTKYFTPERFGVLEKMFSDSRVDYFYLLGFLAFAWEFGVAAPPLFRLSMAITQPLDRALFAVMPFLRERAAWFGVFSGTKSHQ